MRQFAKFARIYKTTILDKGYKKVISDPVKVEIFRGPKSLQVPLQLSRIVPKGQKYTFATDATLWLNDEHQYISLITRTKDSEPQAIEKCKDEIDQVITSLSTIYKPAIFSDPVYSGWIRENDNDALMSSTWVTAADKLDIDEKDLTTRLKNIKKQLSSDPDLKERFRLMSRFYAKAVILNPSEEQFLFLWTVLEVYPMKNTTNIKPISEYLATILGKPATEVKEKLGIGRLFQVRSDLVHNGRLNIDPQDLGAVFSKLEEICLEVIRTLSGLPYGKTLDKYF